MNIIDASNEIKIHFVDGPFVEITGHNTKEYNVKFIDKIDGNVVYNPNLKNNEWAKPSRKWFTDWQIQIFANTGEYTIHDFNAEGKRILISFESKSVGDTIAWIPYIEEFRKKHNCHVLVSTFHNNLFDTVYTDLEFISPGTRVDGLYASYVIGVFLDNNEPDLTKNKNDYRNIPLQKIATDILGLEYQEIKPKIKKLNKYKSDKPYICLGIHSTAQAKYWNNSTGWQELTDYAINNGYDVYCLSKEEDGYMGNTIPNGVKHIQNKTLEEIGEILLGSELFVGVSSGLSWYSWSLNVPTILISGFTDENLEMKNDVVRIINKNVCHGCWSKHLFDRGDWNWCPENKGTEKQFECSKSITFAMVKPHVKKILKLS
jgi:autotransporter strand-loop-strand O-heptosyltransferase